MFARVGGNLYSDDPGTGKTISALLAVMERHLRNADALPALVRTGALAPTRVPDMGRLPAWAPISSRPGFSPAAAAINTISIPVARFCM